MMNFKKLQIWALVILMGVVVSGCEGDKGKESEKQGHLTTTEIYHANQFAKDVLSDVYLWNKDIAKDLVKLNPETNLDPIKTVNDIRYKVGGADVDRWSFLTNDGKSIIDASAGISTTYGYILAFYRIDEVTICGVVCATSEDSPARKAGLMRGDIIYLFNGKSLNEANYTQLYKSKSGSFTFSRKSPDSNITLKDNTIEMTAVAMYENPILADEIIDCGGKKIGYLAYSSFNTNSVQQLVEVAKRFKNAGVKELILDLRYNGGGSVSVEYALASMLAPEVNVLNNDVYDREVWNDKYMQYYISKGKKLNSNFSSKIPYKDHDQKENIFDTKDANINLTKIYALTSSGTASASESILVCLDPYMDIEIIGDITHGKYCTGAIISPKDMNMPYHSSIDNWAIYAMIARYTDKDGNNACMPNGIKPNIKVEDDPREAYPLGDINEKMLKVALKRAGKIYGRSMPTRSTSTLVKTEIGVGLNNPLHGLRIDDRVGVEIAK